MTFPRAESDLLIFAPSFKRSPKISVICLVSYNLSYPNFPNIDQNRFLTKISIFDKIHFHFSENFDSRSNFRLFAKISIFKKNFNFLPKYRFFAEISILLPKYRFFAEISILLPKFLFLTKKSILSPKFRFLTKISIFCRKFRFFAKISIFCGKFRAFAENFYF